MTQAAPWHASDEMLSAYADGDLTRARMASVEAHVGVCEPCRSRVASLADGARLERNLAEIVDRVSLLRRHPLERWLSRLGVPDPTVRALAVSPADRTPWCFGILVALLVAAGLGGADANGRTMFLLLASAPLLPLFAVTMSVTLRLDPLSELTRSTPMPRLWLAVLRSVMVLVPAAGISALVAIVVPTWGWEPALWLAPSLGLSAAALALGTWLPIRHVALALGSVWIGGSMVAFIGAPAQEAVPQFVAFRPVGQFTLLAVTAVAAAIAVRRIDSFEMIHSGRIL